MAREDQFTHVVNSNKDRIYRICCCYVADYESRKDVYQQILINVWRSLDSFEGRSQASTWIYRIAVNTCLAYLRSERRRKTVFAWQSEIDTERIPDTTDNDGQDQLEVDVRRLYDCVLQLGPVNRALISLYLEDLTTREMAEVLGISESNVRVKLHRVKRILKEMMEGSDHGTS